MSEADDALRLQILSQTPSLQEAKSRRSTFTAMRSDGRAAEMRVDVRLKSRRRVSSHGNSQIRTASAWCVFLCVWFVWSVPLPDDGP